MIDVYALDDLLEYGADETHLLGTYIDSLIEGFVDSPEGQEVLTQIEDIGYWIEPFIRYGFAYGGYTLPALDVEEAQEIMEEFLPRKLSLLEPEDADEGLVEMMGFWAYLGREHELSNADSILAYLRSLPPEEFRDLMFDPSRAGMAKSFFMTGNQAGYDMSTQEGMNEFMHVYNAALSVDLTQTSEAKSSTAQPKQKTRKKMVKASRRANRKPKKKKKKKRK